MSHRATITVPLEADGPHDVRDVADNLCQEHVTVEFTVTDEETAHGTLVRFYGDADELEELARERLSGLEHLIERA